jgi:hypothetical protein
MDLRERVGGMSYPAKVRAGALLGVVLLLSVFAMVRLDDGDESSESTARAWPPPALIDPKTVVLKDGQTSVKLTPGVDYRLVLPCGGLKTKNGLVVRGGRNVVMHSGTIEVTKPEGGRALLLTDQTGTVDIAEVHLKGHLTEGIDITQDKGAIVQLQDILVDPVRGSRGSNHADVVQTWAGPRQLRIDGLRGSSNYQGLFLVPDERNKGPLPERFDLRNIDLTMQKGSAYALWRGDNPWPISVQNVRVHREEPRSRDMTLWPKPSTGDNTWAAATVDENVPTHTPSRAMSGCS